MASAERTCTRCLVAYPEAEGNFSRRLDGWAYWCKRCAKEAAATWRAENEAHAREYRRRRATRVAAAAGTARYRSKNPEIFRVSASNRRARKAGAPGRITLADIRAVTAQQEGRCYWCSVDLGAGVHTDHLIPISRGGRNEKSNIVASCPTCNRAKGSKTPAEFEALREQRQAAS